MIQENIFRELFLSEYEESYGDGFKSLINRDVIKSQYAAKFNEQTQFVSR